MLSYSLGPGPLLSTQQGEGKKKKKRKETLPPFSSAFYHIRTYERGPGSRLHAVYKNYTFWHPYIHLEQKYSYLEIALFNNNLLNKAISR